MSHLQCLQEAFNTADTNNDDLLNKQEFTKFVEIAYHKQCPTGMYENVCQRFKSDPMIGINWNTAKTIYMQANQQKTSKSRTNQTKTPKSTITNMKSEASHSNSSSNSSNTIRHNSVSHSSDVTDTNAQYKLRRTSTLSSTEFHRKNRTNSTEPFTDTSSMIVDMLDNKNKTLQNKLLKEHAKRKKTEEIAQSLLNQNDEYKAEIGQLKNENNKLKNENKILNEENMKYRTTVIEHGNNIKHLTQQRNQMQIEVDQSYNLCMKIEKENSLKIKKIKIKHKKELENLCNGFLESLGAEPGTKDIGAVIEKMKMNNINLQKTVDILNESLVRKQQSLIEALKAVDNICMESANNIEQKVEINNNNYTDKNSGNMKGKNKNKKKNKKKIRNKLKKWNQRRKSFGLQRRFSISNSLSGIHRTHSIADTDFVGVSELKENEIPNFNNDNDNDNDNDNYNQNQNSVSFMSVSEHKLGIDDVNNMKGMQFLSLTSDVANKRQSIQNLEIANSVLFEQMHKMKKQMDQMKNEKNKYDNIHNNESSGRNEDNNNNNNM